MLNNQRQCHPKKGEEFRRSDHYWWQTLIHRVGEGDQVALVLTMAGENHSVVGGVFARHHEQTPARISPP